MVELSAVGPMEPARRGGQARPDLARRLDAETQFSDVRATGGSLSDLVTALGSAVPSVIYLLAPNERVVARSVPRQSKTSSIPRLARLLTAAGSELGAGHCAPVTLAVGSDGPSDFLVVEVTADAETMAYLVVAIDAEDDSVDVVWIVERAAVHLAGEYAAQRRLARVAWNARSNLGRQMIRSTDYDEDLRAAAEYLGVSLEADRVIVFVLERGGGTTATVDARQLGEFVESRLGLEVLPVRGSEGALLAIAVPAGADPAAVVGQVKRAVVAGLDVQGDRDSIAGVSSVTRSGQLRRAYREAREVARCIDRYASRELRTVGCDELGPARLFVANSDEHSVRLYVHDVLGPLLGGGSGSVDLLRTLAAFFQAGRSIRETGNLLGVHENTVRHRLNKVHELTGLNVVGSQDQLTLHTALLVLRLQGHPAVPTFDDHW